MLDTFRLHKLLSSNDIRIDNHTRTAYACEACGCIVYDKLKHAEAMHNGASPVIVNTFTDNDRRLNNKEDKIRKAGKKILIYKSDDVPKL